MDEVETEAEAKRKRKEARRAKMTTTFHFHGKDFEVDRRAFYIVPAKLFIRKPVIWLATWRWFD